LAAKNISAASLTALYEKHGSTLAAYLCCGVEFASAEDAVQQLFLKLMRSKVSMPEEPLAYLYRAVRNTSFNLRRSTRREVELNETENWLMEPEGRAEEALSVQAALRDIPQEQRKTVFLKIWGA
jgi:DNA-directed RNA polymerase specialized sigma24 family protein